MRIFLFVALFEVAFFIQSPAQSFLQQTVDANKTLTDIQMVSSSVGYAGGVDGVYKTIDGGQTWTLLSFFQPSGDFEKDLVTQYFNVVHLHFFNELEGLAYGWHAFNQEIVMRTTNGGTSWVVTHLKGPETTEYNFHELRSLYAWSDTEIIIVGNSGRILRSNDSGEHWTESSVDDEEKDLVRVQFVSASVGYTAGERRFYTSSDAGVHWSYRNLNFEINDFYFFDALHGIAVGEQGYIYKTTDGGVTWNEGLMQAEGQLTHLAFVNAQVGYAAGNSGLIYKTMDGGESWLRLYADPHAIAAISLLTADNIWFGIENGYLLHSTNGGQPSLVAPVVSSISPAAGKIGNTIGLSGSDFRGVLSVKINGISASFKINSETAIIFKVPRGATTGKIELVWPGGSSFSSADFVIGKEPQLYSPAPNVTSRGTTVLQGENLQYVTALTLKGVSIPFTILSSQEISFDIPLDFPAYPQPVVAVTSPFGNASRTLTLISKPNVTMAVVDFGISAPGKTVTIYGNGLQYATSVKFGTIEATSFTVISDTEILCKVPDVANKVMAPIYVTTPGGTGVSLKEYTILPAPVIHSVSPLALQAGEEIKIEGDFFPTSRTLFWNAWIDDSVLSNFDVRLVDEHTLYLRQPVYLTGTDRATAISISNEGGLKGSKTVPLTITGRVPDRIDRVSPIRVSNSGLVTVNGTFSFVDSVTVNGTRQTIYSRLPGEIGFFLKPQTNSGMVTIYQGDVPLTYGQELVVTENPSPSIVFSPKVASTGETITVQCGNVRFINSIKVNGRAVSFEPSYAMGYLSDVSFTVTDDLTSGYVSIITPDGEFTTTSKLIISPYGKPIIDEVIKVNESTDYFVKISGNHFSGVTNVRFDQFDAAFVIQDEHTLLVEYPTDPGITFSYTTWIVVESAYGQAEYSFSQTNRPVQDIVSITPLVGKRNSYVTVTLSPQKPYLSYESYPLFYFGSTMTQNWERIDNNTYRVQVPGEGEVEGKIGISSRGSNISYFNTPFSLATSGYCNATGTSTTFSLKKLMIQGNTVSIPNTPYLDYSSTIFEVIPNQVLRIGATPLQPGVVSKVYIDWNGNEEFEEGGVLLAGSYPYIAVRDSMIYHRIQVPASASLNKQVRMRIVSRLYGDDLIAPCGLINGGQVIDYTLKIMPPSSTLKVVDFYPSIGTAGTKVTVVGDHLDAVTSVTLNGQSMGYSPLSPTVAELVILEGATDGKLEFGTEDQTVTMTRDFRIDASIVPPTDPRENFNYIYRATMNGNDVGFFYVFTEGVGYQVFPVMEFPVDGTFCIFTPGGEYCFDEPLKFQYFIDFPDPFIVTAGESVTLRGHNLAGITQVMLTETGESLPFTATESTLQFTPPETNATSNTLSITGYAITEKQMNYQPGEPVDPPFCDTYSGWREGAEIINLKFNQINNTSGKNVTGGRSDYSSQIAIVDKYYSYYTDATIKNFSTSTQYVTVSVFVGDSPLVNLNATKVGSSEGIMIEPNEEHLVHPYFYIPTNIALNAQTAIWFLLEYNSFEGCQSAVAELEKYSIVVKQDPLVSNLQLLSMSTSVARTNDEVEIEGTNFSEVKSLQLGEVYTPFTIVSADRIRFTVPAGAASGKITITSLTADAQSATPLTVVQPHTVTSIDPPSGRAGDVILLHGTNLSSVTSILFDDVPSQNFVLQNSTTIRLKISSTAKTGPIRLKNSFDQQVSSNTFYFCDGITPNPYCKANQQITFADLQPVSFGQSDFSLTAASNSMLPVSYTSSNTAVATISGSVVTIVGVGNTLIKASQPGSSSYFPATPVEKLLVVTKGSQTITFNDLPTQSYGQPRFKLTATSNSSLRVRYTSSNTSVATISGDSVTIVGVGNTTITATQPGNPYYLQATPVEKTLVVTKGEQTITFNDLHSQNYGQAPFVLTASSSSSLPVSYSSSNTSVATVSGANVTIVGVGSATITASQPGSVLYNAAVSVQHELMVGKGEQVISFSDLPAKRFNDVPFNLAATSSSPLEIVYSSSNTAVATIVEKTVTIVGVGTTTITALQSGNENYEAGQVSKELLVTKGDQLISFNALPRMFASDSPFELSATASSGLPVSYVSGNTSVATIDKNVITIIGSGTAVITASQLGDDNYNPALAVSRELEISTVTAIEDTKSIVQVYPNPTNGMVVIETPSCENGGLIVVENTLGIVVFSKEILNGNQKQVLDLRDLPPGVYLIVFSCGDQTTKSRIVRN